MMSKQKFIVFKCILKFSIHGNYNYSFFCIIRASTDLNAILECCDYICNVLPSTKSTEGLLDGDVLKNCKKVILLRLCVY